MSPTSDFGPAENGPDDLRRAVPIACSLSTGEARDRVARWSRLVRDAKTNARARVGLVQATFRNEAAVPNELERLVAAERECDFVFEPDGNAIAARTVSCSAFVESVALQEALVSSRLAPTASTVP